MTIQQAEAGTVAVGDELPTMEVGDIDVEHILQLALILRDANPIHYDLDAIAAAGLGEVEVNQGGATAAYILNLLSAWSGSRSNIRRLRCRFSANVFAGDDVLVGGTVTAIEESSDGQLVTCDVWAAVHGGDRAITGTATVLLPADGGMRVGGRS
ncbi:MaoC/PaaZ C-terminal domain-containing protein [Georgenia sp. SYP-B2076]|uniref:MaoC/PaaZ C-terminal domain-containing protein n=1 Tax=Georgenia sp. SYP-B2076 TaxID=2495881 RepID=UPI00197AFFBB|nr:MaoC/PaaZ C-terminal domain-containing protein [Georgenia sp. SYP-B2076]